MSFRSPNNSMYFALTPNGVQYISDHHDHEHKDTSDISPLKQKDSYSLNLNEVDINSSKSLELKTQRELLLPLELHTLDTVWHQIIPTIHRISCKCICCKRNNKPFNKTKVDHMIHFIYSKCHLFCVTLSTVLYIVYVLTGWYEYNQILTSVVYWWFIIECMLLLYTANYRMFKEFLFNFTFWYKITSITIGVISRQLCFDGTDRYLLDVWHMISGISFIISYFVASQIVAGIHAFYWPISLKFVFIALTSFLNAFQVWQIYSNNKYEYQIEFMGHILSLRHTAMSAFTNATLFHLRQLWMDTYYRDYMQTKLRIKWEIDNTSHELFYSGRYNSGKVLTYSHLKRLRKILPKTQTSKSENLL